MTNINKTLGPWSLCTHENGVDLRLSRIGVQGAVISDGPHRDILRALFNNEGKASFKEINVVLGKNHVTPDLESLREIISCHIGPDLFVIKSDRVKLRKKLERSPRNADAKSLSVRL